MACHDPYAARVAPAHLEGNTTLHRVLICLFAVFLPGAFGAESDALLIHQAIKDRHLPYGTILDPFTETPDTQQVRSYTRCGDSAIWTGHYLAAESYRWAVTRSPEAREQVMAALNGIRKLVDVTGTDALARCVYPVDSPYAADLSAEESHHGIQTGIVDGVPQFWVGNTSRDQYMGVFFGLTAAWQMVDDQEVHDWVSMLATRLLLPVITLYCVSSVTSASWKEAAEESYWASPAFMMPAGDLPAKL
jgi:hypothetical protein